MHIHTLPAWFWACHFSSRHITKSHRHKRAWEHWDASRRVMELLGPSSWWRWLMDSIQTVQTQLLLQSQQMSVFSWGVHTSATPNGRILCTSCSLFLTSNIHLHQLSFSLWPLLSKPTRLQEQGIRNQEAMKPSFKSLFFHDSFLFFAQDIYILSSQFWFFCRFAWKVVFFFTPWLWVEVLHEWQNC